MNSGKYKLKSFLTDHNLDQIIIPEIQRDYVWKEENVKKYLKSIKDNADKQSSIAQSVSEEILNQLAPEARDILVRGLEEKKNYCNVGFIYAYFDREFAGRFMLIDGQQRMTTLYLILLCLCVKEGKQEHFTRSYFRDGIPKFDYKVREEAHDFLINFVNHILQGNNCETVEDQHWHYAEYKNDTTINSIYTNYKIIKNFIDNNELSLEYIEDFIEFWYFDTNKSKQGEELYLYMNSRGESVSANESIKAGLLKGLSHEEKHNWGAKWEIWQDLFWKNSKDFQSADNGIEEFLRWIKVIEYAKKSVGQSSTDKKLRGIKDSKRISHEDLTLEKIDCYYNALTTILQYKNDIETKREWFWGETGAIDYFRLLPMLMYAEKFPKCSIIDFKRLSRFFFNISRFDTLSKNPYQTISNIVNLLETFLNSSYKDIADLVEFRSNSSFGNILTHEEVVKLTLYKKQQDEAKRDEIEIAFWEAEDYKFIYGKISFIWDCIDFEATIDNIESFNLEKFKICFSNIKLLFDKPDDLLRRALLTKGDYSIYDGRTSTLDGNRMSFIYEEWRWKQQFLNKHNALIFKNLINDFGQRKLQNPNASREHILNQIISEYLSNNTDINWSYRLVSNPNILKYCIYKLICFSPDAIYVLQFRNAVPDNFKKLDDF